MEHIPVLLNEVVEVFASINSGVMVDSTIGAGGHTLAIAKAITNNQDAKIKEISNSKFQLIGIDQDYDALTVASSNLKAQMSNQSIDHDKTVTLVNGNFRNIKQILQELKIEKVAGILADLGVSSMQINSQERGFSFKYDAPLDMRMDNNNQLTAELIIKTWDERKIADILWRYGEERFSRKIAKAIRENRKNINTTKDLAELCEKCIPPRFRKYKIHPATKTFQALRIAVNDEIEALKDFLADAPELLAPGGRLAIISFHSLEDRLVKQKFNELASSEAFEKITKHVVVASEAEIAQNPRSRSAKLRVIQKK